MRNVAPILFSNLFELSQKLIKQNHEISHHQKLINKRDLLCINLLYQTGKKVDELIKEDFSSLKTHLVPEWAQWLTLFQTELKLDSPWFHTARHHSIREGLSKRSVSLILSNQSLKYHFNDWNLKGFRQAYILKQIQIGIPASQIKKDLNLSLQYNLKPYIEYLETQSPESILYGDIYLK